MRLIYLILLFILTEARQIDHFNNEQLRDHLPVNPSFIDTPSDVSSSYPEYVNFFTVGKEGIFDPTFNLKKPVDFVDPLAFLPPPASEQMQKEMARKLREKLNDTTIDLPIITEKPVKVRVDPDIFPPNWTRCKEFEQKSYFHPQEVLNIDWVSFYVWALQETTAVVYRFSIPTKKVVQQYKNKYDKFLSEPVNWNAPKLLLTEDDEKQMLLIAKGRNGLFQGIMKLNLHPTKHRFKISVSHRVLKIEPPYLIMAICEYPFATAMAVMGTEPQTDEEKIEEGEKITYRGVGAPVSRAPELDMSRQRHKWEWHKEAMERATLRTYRK